MKKGLFLALEGIDGSGKSTQLKLLADRLTAQGIACQLTQEPTDSPIGAMCRQFLNGAIPFDSRTIAALFAADRLNHLLAEDGLCQQIANGITVISDRYYFSNYAYQGVDMDLDWLIAINRPAAQLLRPSLTLFLDLPVELALERIRAGRSHTEIYEKKERLLAVRKQYFAAFAKLQAEENIAVIDADADAATVAERIWQQTARLL